jgi:uncharacterized protein involved in exopolysaccharide biosynthesis
MKGTAESRVEAMGQAAPRSAGAAGDIDVVQLWSALKRNKARIILPTLFALAVSIAGVNMVEPSYTAEARLLLQSGDSYYTRPGTSPDRDPGIDERDVMSQVQVITSRDLAREAIAKLGLKGNPDFDPNMRPQPWRRVLELLGLAHPVGEERAQEKLIEEYRDRVVAFPVLQSRVLVVEFTSRSPELSARGANLVAQLFLDSQAQAKSDTAKTASGWLKETIEPLRARVAEAEAKAEAFRARTGLLVGANNATLIQQQMADMNVQLTTARSAQADAQARANLIRDALKAGRPLESSDVANNELVRKLTADQAALRAQIALESRTLLSGHPRIKELTAQLTQVDAQIRAAAEKAVRTLENDALVSQARVDSLSAALEALKRQTAASSENEVTLRGLEREAKTLRDQLESLNARYREAEARDVRDASPADARIISRADVPSTPSFPKKIPIVTVATLGTFLIAIALVLTRELVSGRAFVPEPRWNGAPRLDAATAEAEALPVVRPLPDPLVLQTTDLEPRLAGPSTAVPDRVAAQLVTPDQAPPANDGLLDLLEPAAMAAVLQTLREVAGEGFVCLASGVDRKQARDGALALGRALAARCRTVLVDATASGAVGQPGLRDLGRPGVTFARIIHRDPRSRLHLVGPGSLRPDEALNEGYDRSLEALRQTYDCVIVCCDRPGEGASLARWLAETVEPVIVVATSHEAAQPVCADFLRVRPGRDRPLVMTPLQSVAGAA